MDAPTRDLLRRLSLAAGPPGAEDEVRAIVRERLEGIGRLSHDRLGSVLCEVSGSSAAPRLVLDCHLDEVAFMVRAIAPLGGVGFVPLGGWWGHVLLGQRVEILSDAGRIPGVIGSSPPHFLDNDERNRVVAIDSMYIDVGASTKAQAESLGIRVGDMVVPSAEFREMAVDGVISGKAFDNRAGVALMCAALGRLADLDPPCTLIGVGAVQEEIGARGAATSSELARPDVALVLECSPADDVPGQSDRQSVLGGGPQIRHYDPTAVANRRLVRFVQSVADACGIQLQMAVRKSGGTDAGAIHRHRLGVPTVVIGVPARYIHSHVALMQTADFDAALELVVQTAIRLDSNVADQLVRFD